MSWLFLEVLFGLKFEKLTHKLGTSLSRPEKVYDGGVFQSSGFVASIGLFYVILSTAIDSRNGRLSKVVSVTDGTGNDHPGRRQQLKYRKKHQ